MPGKAQYIGQLELLYCVASYASLPHVFSGRQVIHFVDNTSACAALVKGYARPVDSGLIVNAFHALNVGLHADVFFEYVRSAANVADLPSRGALGELRRVLRRVGIAAEPVPCILPPFSAWDAPARWWLRQATRPCDRPWQGGTRLDGASVRFGPVQWCVWCPRIIEI